MNDKEILACLHALGWEEQYTNKPYVKYYRFQVPTTSGWEYFYLDRSASDAKLCLHPRFFDWRNEFRKLSGVEIGGNTALKLKSADMLDFPMVKGGTNNDIPEFFPLRFYSRDALLSAVEVIADKARFKSVIGIQNSDTSTVDNSGRPKAIHPETELPVAKSQGGRRAITEEDLLRILSRQRENGAAGELIAIEWEKMRLRDCGCSTPDDFVEHTSKVDVGAGFDIHSRWPGEPERFIEVKTTAGDANFFFMSENEKELLKDKAEKSYIYIVDLDASGADTGAVRAPINFSETELEFEPVAYRVRVKNLESPK